MGQIGTLTEFPLSSASEISWFASNGTENADLCLGTTDLTCANHQASRVGLRR